MSPDSLSVTAASPSTALVSWQPSSQGTVAEVGQLLNNLVVIMCIKDTEVEESIQNKLY